MTEAEFRDALKDLGIRQHWLAQRLGVEDSTVSRWATGKLPVPAYVPLLIGLLRERKHLSAAILSLTEAIKSQEHFR